MIYAVRHFLFLHAVLSHSQSDGILYQVTLPQHVKTSSQRWHLFLIQKTLV